MIGELIHSSYWNASDLNLQVLNLIKACPRPEGLNFQDLKNQLQHMSVASIKWVFGFCELGFQNYTHFTSPRFPLMRSEFKKKNNCWLIRGKLFSHGKIGKGLIKMVLPVTSLIHCFIQQTVSPVTCEVCNFEQKLTWYLLWNLVWRNEILTPGPQVYSLIGVTVPDVESVPHAIWT